jgi:hypothetical protein
VYILSVSGNAFIFYLLPSSRYNPNAVLALGLLCLCLLPFAYKRALFVPLIHSVTVLSVVLVAYVASQTGGINSSALVWLNVLTVPVLLLLGLPSAMVWIALMLTTIGGMYC